MAHYIVTGSSGFIASHTCESLLLSGHKVTGIDNMNDAYDVIIKEHRLKKLKQHPNFIFSNVDITDLNALQKIINDRYDSIINLGARAGVRASADNPFIYYDTNVTGTLNLLEISKQYEIPNCSICLCSFGVPSEANSKDGNFFCILALINFSNALSADVTGS